MYSFLYHILALEIISYSNFPDVGFLIPYGCGETFSNIEIFPFDTPAVDHVKDQLKLPIYVSGSKNTPVTIESKCLFEH